MRIFAIASLLMSMLLTAPALAFSGSMEFPELFKYDDQKNANLETALLSILTSFKNNSVSITQELLAAIMATLDKEVGVEYLPVEEGGDYGMGPGCSYKIKGSCRSTPYDGGVDYKGRGYIQITHKRNYQKYCPDCVGTSTPELNICGCKNQWECTVTNASICPQVKALQPNYAAEIFASYYINNGLVSLSNSMSYNAVGKAINGGEAYASDFNTKANAYLMLFHNNPDKTEKLLTWLGSGTMAAVEVVSIGLPITLTLYVHEGDADGPTISGVQATGEDGAGHSFEQTTNSDGYVTITGIPGTWSFSASADGYETNNWDQEITETETKDAFLQKLTDVVGVELPSQVLLPVDGPLEVVSTLGDCSNIQWCFNQHQTGGHVVGGGICGADDTYAWDANLNTPTHDSDNNQPVYAVAPGTVAQTFGGCLNADDPGSYGQVLVEHEYQGTKWWSGYLHMANIQVSKGQSVTQDTVLGYVSNVGVLDKNNHLHFAVYIGENSRNMLRSFNTQIIARSGTLEAEIVSTDSIDLDSDNAKTWKEKGDALCNQDKYNEANKAYEEAIRLDPNFADAWSNKGLALDNLGRYNEALNACNQAIELNPLLADAWCNKGFALSGLRKYDEALEIYNKAIEIDPQLPQAWGGRCAVWLEGFERYNDALKDSEKALELLRAEEESKSDLACPGRLVSWADTAETVWYNHGAVLYYLERYEDAINAFEESIKINPEFPDAWQFKGVALEKLNRDEEANDAFERACELDNRSFYCQLKMYKY